MLVSSPTFSDDGVSTRIFHDDYIVPKEHFNHQKLTYLGNVSEPILINKGNDTTDDWLVTLVLPFGVQYIYEFEESGLQPHNWYWLPPDRDLSYDVRLVHWREGIDKETDEVKDYDYLIDNPLS